MPAQIVRVHQVGLRCDRLTVTVPEQGLHLVAELDGAEDDVALAARARAVGFGVKALSPLYHGETIRRGLVIGFSGFSPDVLAEAARRFVSVLQALPMRDAVDPDRQHLR